ncbi:MAG: hypothetical protein M1274_06740 [Actinobacteria bacterium]|nr:hypothetical protein [Actinomycetota bacterium]
MCVSRPNDVVFCDSMKQYLCRIIIVVLAGAAAVSPAAEKESQPPGAGPQGALAGSASCRQCHESFYHLWASSHHGLAMQPYTFAFAQANLMTPDGPLKIGKNEYLACLGKEEGWILERGPEGEKQLRIAHVMGGKNVYYFLTPLDRGRLQTLPVAYDVRTRKWFDTAASGVRHFPGARTDTPVPWTDPMFTFNTSCHGCHVSQLATNYDPGPQPQNSAAGRGPPTRNSALGTPSPTQTDTYRTTWAEPGINCEACHGPAQEHLRVCQGARSVPVGAGPRARPSSEGNRGVGFPNADGSRMGSRLPLRETSQDLKIVRLKPFTAEQINALCGSCHAKLSPLSASFRPGDRFFDRFDLTTLEHPDFYPDGRDLGENYTMTSWRMSPCARRGKGSQTRSLAFGVPKLDCRHCHTSSGRYRFAERQPGAAVPPGDPGPNAACLPCHQDKVDHAPAHTHHPADSAGSRCIGCHMPKTEFARMTRSDHSMRPPTPAATLRFKSPNACNLCHPVLGM